MLAESATIHDGRLSLLGAGWMVRPPEAGAPVGIAVMVSIPRDQAGLHQIRLELLDGKSRLVSIESPNGPGEMVIEGAIFPVGRDDPNLKLPLLAPFVVNLPPFPLDSGTEYAWRLRVDGKTRAGWKVAFRTTPP